MPRAFEITSPSSTLSLDAASKGEVTFAVTNQLEHAAKVRASIVSDASTKAEWLTLAEAVKDINVKQTETFTVRVAVPGGTATGDYSFKIIAANDANPEEEATEGPAVKFHVGPAENHKFPWIWVIVAGGVVLLALLAVGAYFLFRPKPPEPTPVTLGQPCDDDKGCALVETCAELPSGGKACLLRPEKECSVDTQCSSFWCREGVCARDDGLCDGDADCRFAALMCLDSHCLKRNDQPCAASAECATGNCQGGKCRPAVAQCNPPCNRPSHCVEGKCTLFFPLDRALIRKNRTILIPH